MSRILGQDILLKKINNLIEYNTLPRFTILVGSRGSGKTLISKYIAEKLGANYVIIEPKIDAVRECIKLAYEQTEPTLYYIPRTDKMSVGAKNALLKVTEEPPQKAYFIMGLYDKQNTLSTLLSRGVLLEINDYSMNTLESYYLNELKGTKNDDSWNLVKYCKTLGELKQFKQEGVNGKELSSIVNKIITSIHQASGGNALKLSQLVRYKTYEEEPDKYDVDLFMNAVIYELNEQIKNNVKLDINVKKVYAEGIVETSRFKQQLNITGINKLATVDQWILKLRKVFMEVLYGID